MFYCVIIEILRKSDKPCFALHIPCLRHLFLSHFCRMRLLAREFWLNSAHKFCDNELRRYATELKKKTIINTCTVLSINIRDLVTETLVLYGGDVASKRASYSLLLLLVLKSQSKLFVPPKTKLLFPRFCGKKILPHFPLHNRSISCRLHNENLVLPLANQNFFTFFRKYGRLWFRYDNSTHRCQFTLDIVYPYPRC